MSVPTARPILPPTPGSGLIPYADVSGQFGLVVDRRPNSGLVITVPPWPWYRQRGIVIALSASLAVTIPPVVWSSWQSGRWGAIVWLLSGLAVAGLVLVAGRWAQQYTPWADPDDDYAARFEVADGRLTVWWQGQQDRQAPMSQFTCGREEIVSIRGDRFRMGLTIRVRGRFIAELLHERPKVLRVWIARTLCEALQVPHPPAATKEG